MKKVKALQILFLALMLIGWIWLTGELFGQMRPFIMKAFVISSWIAMVCEAVCSVIFFVMKKKKQKESKN